MSDRHDLDPEDTAFLEAMERLTEVPDKDRGVSRRGVPRVGSLPRRRRSDAEALDTLDLHRMTTETALRELDGFLQRSRAVGRRRVRVITGKGYHSEGGKPVLKTAVSRWLCRRAEQRVERVDAAPGRLGGSGALIVVLRPRNR